MSEISVATSVSVPWGFHHRPPGLRTPSEIPSRCESPVEIRSLSDHCRGRSHSNESVPFPSPPPPSSPSDIRWSLPRSQSPAPSESVASFLTTPVPPPPPPPPKSSDFCSITGTPTSRSDRFWYADGTVVIRVDNTLYKLYKGILACQSTFFRSEKITAELKAPPLWSPPSPPISRTGKALEATKLYPDPPELVGVGSESVPVELSVARTDFELLLSILFPENFGSNVRLSEENWAAIASAAEELEFNSIRISAETEVLKSFNALKLIDIGRNRVNLNYILEGLRMLCIRVDALTRDEGRCLGVDYAVIVGVAREQLARGSQWSDVDSQVLLEIKEISEENKES